MTATTQPPSSVAFILKAILLPSFVSAESSSAAMPAAIEELAREAERGIHWNTRYPLKVWLNSVNALRDRALEYEKAGKNDVAYVLMARAATIIIQRLPTHPDFEGAYSKQDRIKLTKTGEQYLQYLAALRSKVKHDIGRQQRIQAERASQNPPRHGSPSTAPGTGSTRDQDRNRSYANTPLADALQQLSVQDSHRQIAADVAHRTHRTFEYPSMPDAADYVSKIDYRPRSREREERGSTMTAPPVPSRPDEYARLQPRPANYGQPQVQAQVQAHPPRPEPQPSPSENTPSPLTRRQTGALLPTHIPSSLIPRFLSLAQPNTTARIETLGLLLGREQLAYGRIPMLVVEVLLIPRQTGTADTCSMVGEEQVLEVCLERGLDCLGWIHTHPTQSCFMSSMDLHTHASYQQMLPEAIAIVCAPSQNNGYGIFRLIEPRGLKEVLICKKGGFHPDHDRVYTDTKGSDRGRVVIGSGELEVIDLRGKRSLGLR
ncbi:hypothetical protein NliqN6_1744 [Naganishia liquefaciens]|uniref:MPN domain-containing protein n=1 Tax=Naganishia liquefaciens TaxID=104408 RepID=A0A8H3TQH2_9TREE|nr:hypothetical protein NliqN6_1744 [Naganishia liquefaciens]